ncbi:MAG: sugar phosphate isomerase/epimerase [Anaerolineae bacterium]|nr:sugar phosphate isomerase/epimerase [Anaerolineae bacterium]
MLKFSIASFSFHRLLADGKQDMFGYIADSKRLGAVQLDPWNAHLSALQDEDAVIRGGRDPENAQFSAQNDDYLVRVKAAAEAVGLPFGCLAVDGAHIYESDAEKRRSNRAAAYRWLEVAEKLGAQQVRIDAGGPEDMPDDVFEIIVAGYDDVIRRAGNKGIEVLVENHWGPTKFPDHVIKLLDAVKGLSLLFDTNNWAEGHQQEGWQRCARYARSVHVKTFAFDAAGNDPTVDIPQVIQILVEAGYDGVWGIESVPRDGDEIGAVRKTAALIERTLAAIESE